MKKNNFIEGTKFGLGIIFIFSVLGLVYAVGFHIAEEILPGSFTGNYTFNGSVNISSGNNICINNQYCLNKTNKTIRTGFPDMIMCDSSGTLLYLLIEQITPANNIIYSPTFGEASSNRYYVSYSLTTTSYVGHSTMSSYDCVTNTWNISELYANNRAFNFLG